MTTYTVLREVLAPHGLHISGHFASDSNQTTALISPDEPHFWDIFIQSAEYNDGAPNALDRWSTRTLTTIAQNHNLQTVFPFGGPPFAPFYTWALKTGQFWASPINFLVHAQTGLFTSFRGAFEIPTTWEAAPPATKPCDTCTDQPCKTACPVGAFLDGYDVQACKTHLTKPKGVDCMNTGCRARRICPIGQGNRPPAQAAFHMKAFQ